ncbi:MAG: hypothetical protein LBC64_11510 [Fibromonadaceae bacterium]|jgi:hypothetical protein|nr:hypothetical protein [Fibromonadaceae bacterium]
MNVGSPISEDLMNRYYDNKAITPQIRSALQKKQDDFFKDEGSSASSSSASASKSGPAVRLSITDQIIRMNIANNSTKKEKEATPEDTKDAKKPSRYDILAEVKKSVAEREAVAKKEKDDQLQAIKDKIAAAEAAKKEAETAKQEDKADAANQEEGTSVTP